MELTLSDAIAEYIEQRKFTKLEPLQKVRDKILNKNESLIEVERANADYREAASTIESLFNPINWLTDAAKRAKQISLATHAAKFTHSDAKASSILVNGNDHDHLSYLVTASLKNKAIDAVGNAAALDVAKLLKISVRGETLIQQLQSKHIDALAAFTNNTTLLNEWKSGFEKALGDEKLSGHTLTKQLYFPITPSPSVKQEYHLICPLFSSSLAHELHRQVTQTRFGDFKDIREARKKGYYHSKLDHSFPATAVQNFGGSKPQNISQLNSERYGQSFLLNCAPPTYQKQNKSPLNSHSIFNRDFDFKTFPLIREFKAFLIGLSEEERNFETRYKHDYGFVLPIIDALLNQAVMIQNIIERKDWELNDNCQMKQAYRLWFDVYNQSENFQGERKKGYWLKVIANDFARWLLSKLESKQHYILGNVELNYYKKVCLAELKSYEFHSLKFGGV
jgi:CRISPR-associated protein Csy1